MPAVFLFSRFLSHHYHPWNYYRGFLQTRRSLYPFNISFPCPDNHKFNIVRARLYCLKGYRSTSYLLYSRDIHPVECMVKCTISPQIYYFSTLKPNFNVKKYYVLTKKRHPAFSIGVFIIVTLFIVPPTS